MTVVERVAEAAGCSDPAQLTEFSKDRSPQVRREVAANPHTPSSSLDQLAGDPDWRVRGAVGLHPDTSDAGLLRLVDDARWEVRLTMLNRPNLSLTVMLAICGGTRMDARRVLAGDRGIPLPVAKKLASDGDWQVRQELAENTAFDEVRTILRTDSRPGVRALAADRAEPSQYRTSEQWSPSPDRRGSGAPQIGPADLARWPTQPRKPTTTWLTIASNFRPSQDEIPPYVEWLWQVAKAIDTDPAWVRWWSSSPVDVLALHPSPDAEANVITLHREQNVLQVRGGSAALFACTEHASSREEADRVLLEPPARQLFLELLRAMFTRVSANAGLAPAPSLPAAKLT